MSRPTKTDEQRRTVKMGARLTPTEAELVKQRAEKKRLRLSEYTRERILSEAR